MYTSIGGAPGCKNFPLIFVMLHLLPAKKCSPVELNRNSMSDQPSRPVNKGLVFDDSIQLAPYATVTVQIPPNKTITVLKS